MNVEQLLEHELGLVANELEIPAAPVTALVRAGEQDVVRRRGWAAGIAAAAAVAVIVAGVALADRDPRAGRELDPAPSPTATTTGGATSGVLDEADGFVTGDPPIAPYVIGTQLFVDGRPIDGEWDASTVNAHASGGTVVVRDANDEWFLVTEGRAEPLANDRGEPQVSHSGRWLAHMAGDELVLYDVRDDREVGRLTVEEEAPPEGVPWTRVPIGVTDDGQVLLGGDQTQLWDGAGPTVPLVDWEGFPARVMTVLSRHVVLVRGEASAVLATIDDAGKAAEIRVLGDIFGDSLSPTGDWTLTTAHLDLQTPTLAIARNKVSGEEFEIPLRAGTYPGVHWESGDTVLILATDRVIRCRLAERSCEYAVAPS